MPDISGIHPNLNTDLMPPSGLNLHSEDITNLMHQSLTPNESENEQQPQQMDPTESSIDVPGAEGQNKYVPRLQTSPPIGNGGFVSIIAAGVNSNGSDRMDRCIIGNGERGISGRTSVSSDYGRDHPPPSVHHPHHLQHHTMTYHNMFTSSREPGTLWRCRSCGKEVSNRWHHFHSHTAQRSMCPYCPATYSRIDTLRSHLKIKHKEHLHKH
jgi:DNA-directed RNA polymerase subunit RPC12/RpoP